MTTTNTVDAARVELLLSELRLPGVKLIWAKLAEQSDTPARSLAAGADVQRPGSCEQLKRPRSIDRPTAEFAK